MPKTVIDPCTAITGWSVSNGTVTLEDHPEFTTSFLLGPLRFTFTAAGVATKTFSQVIPIRRNFAFSIVCKSKDQISALTDYRLKIKFYDGLSSVEYYVPLDTQFKQIVFNSKTLVNLSKIEIISVVAVDVMISEIHTYEDQFPLDSYQGILDLIEENISSDDLIQIGTITCSAGNKEVWISAAKYIDKLAVIKFGTETHQIVSSTTENKIKFNTNYDGIEVLSDYNNVPVYLQIPVMVENNQFESPIPGISVDGSFQAEQHEDFEMYSPETDSLSTDPDVRTFLTGLTWKHKFTIQGQARHGKMNEIILGILKRCLHGKTIFYINGRRHELHCQPVQWIEYGDATDILSKINCEVEAWVTEESPQTEETQIYGDLTLTVALSRLN